MAKGDSRNDIFKENNRRVKEAADIVRVVESRIPIKKRYQNYVTCNCPFHEGDTKGKLTVYKNGAFQCWSSDCQASREHMRHQGDVIEFVKMYENKDYNEALQTLAAEFGVELEKIEYTPEERKQRAKDKANRQKSRQEKRERQGKTKHAPEKKTRAEREAKRIVEDEGMTMADWAAYDDADAMAEAAEAYAMEMGGVDPEYQAALERAMGPNAAIAARASRRASKMTEEEAMAVFDQRAQDGIKAYWKKIEREREQKAIKNGEEVKPKKKLDKNMTTSFISPEDAAKAGISPEKYERMKAAFEAERAGGTKKKEGAERAVDAGAKKQPWKREFTPKEKRAYALAKSREERKAARIEALKEMSERNAARAEEVEVEHGARTPDGQTRTMHVGIVGGPGVGKQAAALEIASQLRRMGWTAAVTESVPNTFIAMGAKEVLNVGTTENMEMVRGVTLDRIAEWEDKVDFVVTPNPPVQAIAYLSDEDDAAKAFKERAYAEHKAGNEFTFYLKRDPEAPYDRTAHLQGPADLDTIDQIVYNWMFYEYKFDGGMRPASYDHKKIDDGLVASNIEKAYARAYGKEPLDLKPEAYARAEIAMAYSPYPGAVEFAAAAIDAGWKPSEAQKAAGALKEDDRLGALTESVKKGMSYEKVKEFAPEAFVEKKQEPKKPERKAPPAAGNKAPGKPVPGKTPPQQLNQQRRRPPEPPEAGQMRAVR